MKRVIKNGGSHGVDSMGCDELRTNIIKHWDSIKRKLLEGTYKSSLVRRVKIRIHEKSYKRLKDKIREVTKRNNGISMEMRLKRLGQVTTGCINNSWK